MATHPTDPLTAGRTASRPGPPPTATAGRTPPTPRGGAVLGSALDLQRNFLGTIERAQREHGDVVRFVVGPPGLRHFVYAVFHPDGVRRVLATEADAYRKDNVF
jgi:hypothetical protein